MNKPNIETSSNLEKNLRIAKGRGSELATILEQVLQYKKGKRLLNFKDVMPLLFQYNGGPLGLDGHFPLEPLFETVLPREVTLMCSRQVGKTVGLSSRALINLAWNPHWNALFVAPFFETIRRTSTDYFATLMDQSPAREIFYRSGCTRQVLERTLPNDSRIRFTYAHRSADRARGTHANELICDEFQLMVPEVLPVLTATMNASPHGNIITRAGTPLTNANSLSRVFKSESSRSHWMIPCDHCPHENIAAPEYDLVSMIGPLRDDIGPKSAAIRCSKCLKPLRPQAGRFVHLNPDARNLHLGLHIPLTILPMHCCSYEKWRDFIKVMSDPFVPTYKKYNEFLGAPYDDGVSLVTETDMERVAVLHRNNLGEAIKNISRYSGRIILGIDWGGGGLSGESLTKVAVCGLNSNGIVDVIFGMQFPSAATTQEQALVIHHIWKTTKAQYIAHDNIGIGSKCEAMLIEKGIPLSVMVPMEYTGETQGTIMKQRKATPDRPRAVISVDKTRGLLHLIEVIKSQKIRTFQMTESAHARTLLLDLTHLRAEERVYIHSVKSETILIQKEPGTSDDFAHAVHFAANCLWMINDAWPKLTNSISIVTPQDLATYVDNLSRCVDPETLESLIYETTLAS